MRNGLIRAQGKTRSLMHNKEDQNSLTQGLWSLLFLGVNETESPHESSARKGVTRETAAVTRCCWDQSQESPRWTCYASRMSFSQLVQSQQYSWWRKEGGEVVLLTGTGLCCGTIGTWWCWTVSTCRWEAERERRWGLVSPTHLISGVVRFWPVIVSDTA